MNEKLLIECDFDGVLYSTSKRLLDDVFTKFGIKYTEKDIKTYNFSTFPSNIRSYIFSRFYIPEVMTDENYLFNDSIEFLKYVNTQPQLDFEIRTLMMNETVLEKRKVFFENIVRKHSLNNIKCTLELEEKHELPCDILIEDNPAAILRKKDGLIIVKRHAYNMHIKESNNILIVESLKEIKDILENILSGTLTVSTENSLKLKK